MQKQSEIFIIPDFQQLLCYIQYSYLFLFQFYYQQFQLDYFYISKYDIQSIIQTFQQIIKIQYQQLIQYLNITQYHPFQIKSNQELIIKTSEKIKQSSKIYVLVGAGISTKCGIPDFRSEKGLYNQKNNQNLLFPEQVFDIEYYYKRPIPFYNISQIFSIEGTDNQCCNFTPSFTHFFLKQLENLSKSYYLVTQNIDDLEKVVKIKQLCQAHGSFSSDLYCQQCKKYIKNKAFQMAIKNRGIVCCDQCGKILKPDIVFYGEDLSVDIPKMFIEVQQSDILIVLGTSLQVGPVNQISYYMNDLDKPRILINNEHAGDIGQNKKDIVLLGDCDEICRQLSQQLKIEDQIDKNIKEFKEKNKVKNNNSQLIKIEYIYAIIMNSLILPTMKFIQKGDDIYSLVQITKQQETLLQQYIYDQNKYKQEIIDYFYEFKIENDIDEVKIYNKKVNHTGYLIYSPINGDISFYCSKIILSQNKELLDQISSQQGTYKKEKYFYQNCRCLEGHISYIMLIKFIINNVVEGKLLSKSDHEIQIEEFEYMDQCDYVLDMKDDDINKLLLQSKQFLEYQIQSL